MNADSLVNDCLPEPPTPTSKTFPPGELTILASLKRCFSASSKITRFIYLD